MRGRPPSTVRLRRYPNRLRELREHCGLSQQEVAAAAGISVAYYGAIERGDKRINAEIAERLCAPLQCAVGDLLGGGQGLSVPLVLAVAAAEAPGRPDSYDLPEPYERLYPSRLAQAADCVAAEIFDDSADLDFAAGTVLFARTLRDPAPPLAAGAKILVRFYLDSDAEPGGGARATHEVLYGILDRNIVGDLVLITRTRNRVIPRNAVIQTAEPLRGGLAERAVPLLPRDGLIRYRPRPDDPGEILGVVFYAMGPT